MDRRIRVKCPECAASIELRVDQQELLDVTCPRCQHLFTAKVPPPVLEIVPLEADEIIEPIEEVPPVRQTRVAQPAPAPRPKRIRQLPPASAAPATYDNTWLSPSPQYQSSPQRVSSATHIKAFLIAAGSIVCLGLLIMSGIMIRSAVSKIEWPTATNNESQSDTQLASSTTSPTATSDVAGPIAQPQAAEPNYSPTGLAPNDTNSSTSATAPATTSPPPAASNNPGNNPGNSDIATKIVLLANQIADASKDQDNEFILDRTHPKLIELAGGRSKMLEILNLALEPMRKQGITIANYTVSSNVTIRQVGQKIFAVIPTTLDLKYPNRTTRTESFLLAISDDGGRTYSFIDGSGAAKNRNMLKVVLPDLPDDMVLPTPTTPREVSP